MKKILLISGILFAIIVSACSKSNDTAPDNTAATLKFENLVAQDTVIAVNAVTTITANATGEGLTYKWTATFGTFIGSGKTVQWTVCHADKFTITCQVTDKNNKSETRDVVIRTRN
jgi:hypothetical protein